MEKPRIYTVGHSTHSIDYFVEMLYEYSISCVVDVRSVAASSYNPQYNQETLKKYLNNRNIQYLHFHEEFGARHTDPDLLDDNGKVDFEKVRKSWSFKKGVDRLWLGIDKGFIIGLMCSESEPLDCHRFSMVSVALANNGFDVFHILKDKTIKPNIELEKQLLKKYEKKIPMPDMFNQDINLDVQLAAAYKFKNQEIGFSPYSKIPQFDKYD